MSSGPTPRPLYEVIHKSRKGDGKNAVHIPEWMHRAVEMEGKTDAATPNTPGSASTRARWIAWWYRPVRFRLQLGVLLLMSFAMVATLLAAFLIGRKYQEQRDIERERSWVGSHSSLESALERPVQGGLIPPSVPRNLPTSETNGGPATTGSGLGSASDPREPGLNYFRLVTLPAASDEGSRTVAFLQSEGVDAVLILDNNPRFVKLLALPGFAQPGSPEGKRFEERLKRLGRKWKTEHDGSSDWHDMLAEKYKPGIN